MRILSISKDCTISYGRLWDGMSDALTGPGTLFVVNELISSHAAHSCASIDLTQLTLLPALIDCHLHLALPSYNAEELHRRAIGLLSAGVASVRDAGTASSPVFACPPLHVVPTGHAISREGFYGSQIGKEIRSAKEAQKLVDYLASHGASQIKVIASGIFSFTSYGSVGPPAFSVDELRVITEHARRHGLPVMAHASGDEAVRRCLQAGVHSIEHGYFMSEETLRLLADSGTFWVPTLCPVDAQLRHEAGDNGQAIDADVVRRSLDRQMTLVSLAARLGVVIGAGTDAGAPGVDHGPSLHIELSLLAQCGLRHVLRAATTDAARICGLTGDAGAVLAGRKAVLIAVDGDPLADPAILRSAKYLLLPS